MKIKNNALENKWQNCSSELIIEHLLNHYHENLRKDFSDIIPLFSKVATVHGEAHPELIKAFSMLQSLLQDLVSHLQKEEGVLFPTIIEFEKGSEQIQKSFFQGPISVMLIEHQTDSSMVEKIKSTLNDFKTPDNACRSYQMLFNKLIHLTNELADHMYIEENILFNRYYDQNQKCSSDCGCSR